mmetsp:Transcript_4634/g.10008  ORF Transcript_4634/g.10008 Transcript_4634/m.10008 type:complete len:82 (-) Transcript_4634:130-375(-)
MEIVIEAPKTFRAFLSCKPPDRRDTAIGFYASTRATLLFGMISLSGLRHTQRNAYLGAGRHHAHCVHLACTTSGDACRGAS